MSNFNLKINNEQVSVVWTDENEEMKYMCITSDQSLIKDILTKYKSVGMAGHSHGSDPEPQNVWGHKVGLNKDIHLHGLNFNSAKRLLEWIKTLDLGEAKVTCTIQYSGQICLLVQSRDFWEMEQIYIEFPSYYRCKSKTLYHIRYPNQKRFERSFLGDWAALEEDFKAAFSAMKTQVKLNSGGSNE